MKKNTKYALLVDYEYCSGCHTCEVACQKEHGFRPEELGIVLHQLGPVEHTPKVWQFDNIPIPTDLCDHCAVRVTKGKLPSCVHNCQAKCMSFGTIDEMAEAMNGTHAVLYTVA